MGTRSSLGSDATTIALDLIGMQFVGRVPPSDNSFQSNPVAIGDHKLRRGLFTLETHRHTSKKRLKSHRIRANPPHLETPREMVELLGTILRRYTTHDQ